MCWSNNWGLMTFVQVFYWTTIEAVNFVNFMTYTFLMNLSFALVNNFPCFWSFEGKLLEVPTSGWAMTTTSFFLRLRVQLGVNMPAQANRKVQQDEANSKEELFEVYDVVLYLGMIDILQVYNVRKKAEHAYKALQFDPLTISVVEPKLYSRRFINFLEKVFPEQPWIGIAFFFFLLFLLVLMIILGT